MCLAIPAKVVDILDSEWAMVEMGGVKKRVSMALVDDLNVGDYVIVHVGSVLTKMDVEEAEKMLDSIRREAANDDDLGLAVRIA